MTNKNKTKPTFTLTLFFSGPTSLRTLTHPPLCAAHRTGNEDSGQFIKWSLCLCYSFFLTLFLHSSTRSLPWDAVLYELLQHRSFPQAADLHKVLWHVFFPWDTVLEEWTAPAWVSHRPKVLAKPCSCSFMGCSSCQKPAPVWDPHRWQLPSGHVNVRWFGVLHKLIILAYLDY